MSIRNSSTSRQENKNQSEEQPTLQCRMLNIPVEILFLIDDGELTIKQAFLLAYVESLVKCRGEGCWASNEWLARKIRVDDRQLRRLLKELIDMGLVVNKGTINGRRILETKWSRAAE